MSHPHDAAETVPAHDSLAEALRGVEDEAQRLRTQLDDLERWRRLLEIVVATRDVAPAALCAELTKQTELIRAREDVDAATVAELRRTYEECSTRAYSAAKDSVRAFGAALEAAGLEVDGSSRHPRYSVADHAIDVELDERALRATVTVRHGDRAKLPLDIGPVVDRVKEEHERLFSREWKAAPFLAQMKKAYKPLAKKTDKVALRDLAAAMSKPRKPRLDEFAVDLGRLLRDPILETGSTKVSVDQTRDTARGLLLHGLQHSGYVLTLTMEDRA